METTQLPVNDVLFILIGAVMVLSMHAGFAFLEGRYDHSPNYRNARTRNTLVNP